MFTRQHSRLLRPLGVSLALATALSLGGCFGNPLESLIEGVVAGGAEKLIEQATGTKIDMGGEGKLPENFPTNVPLVDGHIMSSVTTKLDGGKTGWMIIMNVPDVQDAMEIARKLLTSAGFEEILWMEKTEGLSMGSFQSDLYGVTLTVPGSEENVISYLVAESDS